MCHESFILKQSNKIIKSTRVRPKQTKEEKSRKRWCFWGQRCLCCWGVTSLPLISWSNRKWKPEGEQVLLDNSNKVKWGCVYPTTNVCHYQLRFFQWILVRLWVPPPTLASSACHSASCITWAQWPAQDDCQRYALDLGPCNMAKGEWLSIAHC